MTSAASVEDLFKGRQFDQEIIVLCVRWYLRYKLSARDLVERRDVNAAKHFFHQAMKSVGPPRVITLDAYAASIVPCEN